MKMCFRKSNVCSTTNLGLYLEGRTHIWLAKTDIYRVINELNTLAALKRAVFIYGHFQMIQRLHKMFWGIVINWNCRNAFITGFISGRSIFFEMLSEKKMSLYSYSTTFLLSVTRISRWKKEQKMKIKYRLDVSCTHLLSTELPRISVTVWLTLIL